MPSIQLVTRLHVLPCDNLTRKLKPVFRRAISSPRCTVIDVDDHSSLEPPRRTATSVPIVGTSRTAAVWIFSPYFLPRSDVVTN